MPAFDGRNTVFWVLQVEHIEIGVVNNRSKPLQPHLVCVSVRSQPLSMQSGLGDIEDGVHKRPLA